MRGRRRILSVVLTGDILIVEDNVIIAMDLEGLVQDLGAERSHHARTVEEALNILQSTPITAAILDFNLASGTSVDVADALSARNIPFVFATGHSDMSVLPERFQSCPLLNKPYSDEEMIAAFNSL
jgi:CheY-like chemotaxis protein